MNKFRITGGKGFHITFPNGVTLSTQFGPGNYGDNYDESFFTEKKDWESNEAEVAMWVNLPHINNSAWITEEFEDHGDQVIGYCDFEKWLRIFNWCLNYKVDVEKSTAKAIEAKKKRDEFKAKLI